MTGYRASSYKIDMCRQSAYTTDMSDIQYTIRSVPKQLDEFLRQQARLSGRSLNAVVLDYLGQSIKVDLEAESDDFAWIIGADTIDNRSLKAIANLKKTDKLKQQIP